MRANAKALRSQGNVAPVDRWPIDRAAMVSLPPLAPTVGLSHRVRLGRDYCVRIDGNDYSVDPKMIGRFIDVRADLDRVTASCGGHRVADHARHWATGRTITDPVHQQTAAALRAELATHRPERGTRLHADRHVVAIRALPDYDTLFGVDFDPRPTPGPITAEGI